MIKIIEQVSELVSSKISAIKLVTQMIKLETKLAALNIYPLIINACVLFAGLITAWLCALGLVGYYLHTVFKMPAVFGILLLLNAIIMAISMGFISRNLRNMSFKHTRDYFSPDKEDEHEQHKTNLQRTDTTKQPTQTGKGETTVL